jgi:hypothetical protein
MRPFDRLRATMTDVRATIKDVMVGLSNHARARPLELFAKPPRMLSLTGL